MMVCDNITTLATFGTSVRANQFAFICCCVNSSESVSSLGISVSIFKLSVVQIAVVFLVILFFVFFVAVTTEGRKSVIATPVVIEVFYGQVSLAPPTPFLSCRLNIFELSIGNFPRVISVAGPVALLTNSSVSIHLSDGFVEFCRRLYLSTLGAAFGLDSRYLAFASRRKSFVIRPFLLSTACLAQVVVTVLVPSYTVEFRYQLNLAAPATFFGVDTGYLVGCSILEPLIADLTTLIVAFFALTA
jgi:hypothetical protein